MPVVKPFQQKQAPKNQFLLKPPTTPERRPSWSSQEEADKIFNSSPFSISLPASNDDVFAATASTRGKNQFPSSSFINKRSQYQQQQQPKRWTPPVKDMMDIVEEQESDISDTEIQLAKILNTFAKGKKKQLEVELLSVEEIEEMEQAVPYMTEVRMKRMAQENIRLISSRMIRYLLCHEFQVRGSRGNTYTIQIGPKLDCTCRDHKVRGTHCKHILYVLLKELKVIDLQNKIYLTLYPDDHILEEIFKKYHSSG